jgi:hypothetical protein
MSGRPVPNPRMLSQLTCRVAFDRTNTASLLCFAEQEERRPSGDTPQSPPRRGCAPATPATLPTETIAPAH